MRNCTQHHANPLPEYNGYKVYWDDGRRSSEDRSYYRWYRKVETSNQIKFEANEKVCSYIGAEVDAAFIKSSIENASFNTPHNVKT
jgi:phosphomannomutase